MSLTYHRVYIIIILHVRVVVRYIVFINLDAPLHINWSSFHVSYTPRVRVPEPNARVAHARSQYWTDVNEPKVRIRLSR